ncbi:hypothetical protein [Mesorhizobium sp. M1136]|uniref:hypothetical protein n=1 Tax=unclassified Mesorhizobium TaxID=325217 RepID=UPI00333A9CF9
MAHDDIASRIVAIRESFRKEDQKDALAKPSEAATVVETMVFVNFNNWQTDFHNFTDFTNA